jgi:hypothetical protein
MHTVLLACAFQYRYFHHTLCLWASCKHTSLAGRQDRRGLGGPCCNMCNACNPCLQESAQQQRQQQGHQQQQQQRHRRHHQQQQQQQQRCARWATWLSTSCLSRSLRWQQTLPRLTTACSVRRASAASIRGWGLPGQSRRCTKTLSTTSLHR